MNLNLNDSIEVFLNAKLPNKITPSQPSKFLVTVQQRWKATKNKDLITPINVTNKDVESSSIEFH